jgi:pimeloyl-ACP methyl ester carboxylesterase
MIFALQQEGIFMYVSRTTSDNKVIIYALAGIATSPDFMEGLRTELVHRYEREGRSAQANLLFPYGDWFVSKRTQLREIAIDLIRGEKSRRRSIGGRRAADAILSSYEGGELVLVGHSGGGVAGVHAAQLLLAEAGINQVRVIQIGSPRCAIPSSMRDEVRYIVSVDASGRWTDPVTRVGSWGAWTKSKSGMFLWNRRGAAPSITEVEIVGGHADYFRSQDPYIVHQISNLQRTVDSFWLWLNDFNRKEEMI